MKFKKRIQQRIWKYDNNQEARKMNQRKIKLYRKGIF